MQLHKPTYPDGLLLADNTDMAIAAQRIATTDNWTELGMDSYRVWGIYNNETNVALYRYIPQHGAYCSCGNPAPCMHTVGLYLRLIQSADTFTTKAIPAFVKVYLQHPFDQRPDDAHTAIANGLTQLDTWMQNLLRFGLGEPKVTTIEFWQSIAERIGAAYMPTIATVLRQMPALFDPTFVPIDSYTASNRGKASTLEGATWVEPMLHQLGRLYLLIRSFERFESHPLATQADLRAGLDWQLTRNDITSEPVRDDWVVIGRREQFLNNDVPSMRVWLYGTQTERIAELRSLGFRREADIFRVPVGYRVNADVLFEPTNGSQRALLVNMNGDSVHDPTIRGRGMEDSVADFAKKLSVNPWLSHYVMILDDVYPTRFDDSWTLRYADGRYLPIDTQFWHKWVLYALSAGSPIQVVSLWDGQALYPLSAIQDGHVVDMNEVLDYKS